MSSIAFETVERKWWTLLASCIAIFAGFNTPRW
jgi:hypothetical protein